MAINCAAIPSELLESELFGYEKGAFTGAAKTTKGKLEYADGGTLFLDEIGDLPLPLQAKLLRFLQERKIERVGGRVEIDIDTRVISATHKNVAELIEEKLFREDLYFRLGEVSVKIPPLRERRGDVPVLAKAFLERFATDMKKPAKRFADNAIEALEGYRWPGNIRELENRIKRAVVMAEGKVVSADDLGLADGETYENALNLREVREKAESAAVKHVLARTEGNISRAAKLLGVRAPRSTTSWSATDRVAEAAGEGRGRRGGVATGRATANRADERTRKGRLNCPVHLPIHGLNRTQGQPTRAKQTMNLLALLRAAFLGAMACVALAGCAEGPGNTAGTPDHAEGNSGTASIPQPEPEPEPGVPDRDSHGTGEPTSPPAVPGLGAALSGGEETNAPDPQTDPEVGPATDPVPTKNPFDIELATDEPDDTTPDPTDPETESTPGGGAADNADDSADREDTNASLPTHAPDGMPYCD